MLLQVAIVVVAVVVVVVVVVIQLMDIGYSCLNVCCSFETHLKSVGSSFIVIFRKKNSYNNY